LISLIKKKTLEYQISKSKETNIIRIEIFLKEMNSKREENRRQDYDRKEKGEKEMNM
jgi:hypothetical protein